MHAAAAYTKLIQVTGGFDLIFLGIGRGGHICFNMPADSLHPYTHLERLSEKTVAGSAHSISQGRLGNAWLRGQCTCTESS